MSIEAIERAPSIMSESGEIPVKDSEILTEESNSPSHTAQTQVDRKPSWQSKLRSLVNPAARVLGAAAAAAATVAVVNSAKGQQEYVPVPKPAQGLTRLLFIPVAERQGTNQNPGTPTPSAEPTKTPTPVEKTPIVRKTIEQFLADARPVDEIPLANGRFLKLVEDPNTIPGQISFSKDPAVRQKVAERLSDTPRDIIIVRPDSYDARPQDFELTHRAINMGGPEAVDAGYIGHYKEVVNGNDVLGWTQSEVGIQPGDEFEFAVALVISEEIACRDETGYWCNENPEPNSQDQRNRMIATRNAIVPLIQVSASASRR